jgi:hypothetical protein
MLFLCIFFITDCHEINLNLLSTKKITICIQKGSHGQPSVLRQKYNCLLAGEGSNHLIF